MVSDQEIRLEAVRSAARVAGGKDDIGNLLIHAEWLTRFIQSGNLPEMDRPASIVARGSVAAD